MATKMCRELGKVIMFTLLLGFPLYLAKTTGSYHYLWFLVLSGFLMIGVFGHYEALERIDNLKQVEKDDGEAE